MENNTNIFFQALSQNIFFPNLKVIPKKDMPFVYKEMIKCWEDISKSGPQTVNSIFAEKICLNACILVDNKPVSWKILSDFFCYGFLEK